MSVSKEQRAAQTKAWAVANPEKIRATQRRWRLNNREKIKARDKSRYSALEARHTMRVKKGLPAPTRPEPLLCECCGGPPTHKKSIALDHEHKTGIFRGWLCFRCNVAIGMLGDTIEGLQKAIAYLERSL